MNLFIPVMKPKLPTIKMVETYLKTLDTNKIYTNQGPLVRQLERRFADLLKVKEENLVLCSSATLAIQGSSYLTNVSDFHVPSYTFSASGLAIRNSGKNLILDDISYDTWQINHAEIKASTNDGILTVYPFGSNLEISEYQNFESVIYDAAASLGSQNLDLSKLGQSHSIIFSLHATKVLGIGEGGLVVFGDHDKANEFRSWINFGFSGSRDSKILGTNAKMSEMQAAYGHAVLDNWEVEKQEWLSVRENAKRIENNFPELFNHNLEIDVSPYWLSYSNPEIKVEIVKIFQRLNIETRDWWTRGLHNMPTFSKYNDKPFPITEKVADSSIGLPFFRDMNDQDFDRIYQALCHVPH
jgi:dTDP-4-amino-4,6-dideoxygalactose transaminase